MTETKVTIRQTDTPSRSKLAGPCWIRLGDETYAATTDRHVTAEVGSIIEAHGKAVLRRASGKPSEQRRTWRLLVTGDPADTVELHTAQYGQAVSALVTGAVLADEQTA